MASKAKRGKKNEGENEDFPAELEEKLIENVRKYDILFDPKNAGFKNIIKKDEKWALIAEDVGRTGKCFVCRLCCL